MLLTLPKNHCSTPDWSSSLEHTHQSGTEGLLVKDFCCRKCCSPVQKTIVAHWTGLAASSTRTSLEQKGYLPVPPSLLENGSQALLLDALASRKLVDDHLELQVRAPAPVGLLVASGGATRRLFLKITYTTPGPNGNKPATGFSVLVSCTARKLKGADSHPDVFDGLLIKWATCFLSATDRRWSVCVCVCFVGSESIELVRNGARP